MFFSLPEDAGWSADRQAVEFGVAIGECSGVVRVPRRMLKRLLPERPSKLTTIDTAIRAPPGPMRMRRRSGIAEKVVLHSLLLAQ
jgi:hypothetical protein